MSAIECPLHWAAWDGDLGRVKALIEAGIDVNAKSVYDKTPLDFCIERLSRTELFKVCRALIAAGATDGDFKLVQALTCEED